VSVTPHIHQRSLCLSILVLLGLLCPWAYADAVAGHEFPARQPDGTTIQVRVWGDEFYVVAESLDGYTLTRDPATGMICYAELSPDGNELLSTGVPAGDADPAALGLTPHLRINPAAARAQALAVRADAERRRWSGPLAPPLQRSTRGPTTGIVRGLCLIIDFSDDEATLPRDAVYDFCNLHRYSEFGNNGCVRDFYFDVSDRRLLYTNIVPVAYYRAQHPKSYYTDPSISYGTRARELIVEALTYWDDTLDYSDFDADGDGIIDALNCFYAGYRNSAWAEGLWPHAWTVEFCADGVCTQSYQITDMQDRLYLRTFCHENGHMLMGWPDLYDYGYESTGVGNFCLMAYGASDTNPCEPCAYLTCQAGWGDVTLLTAPQEYVSVPANVNTFCKYERPGHDNEYYLIENRYNGRRYAAQPDHGLAIWHIDTFGSNDDEQQTPDRHYLVTLVQADGNWDLEHGQNYGDSTDLWAEPGFTDCTPATNPNTQWWDGSPSGLYIEDVSLQGPTMTFTFDTTRDCNDNGVFDYLEIAAGTSRDCDANGIPDECQPDDDGDGVPDACDRCADTPPGTLVGAAGCPLGDLNCDAVLDNFDIAPFVRVLTATPPDYPEYYALWPDCSHLAGDVNNDGTVNNFDISPFVDLLTRN
jgi:M6 family metalloprotease-like protein